MNSLSVNMLNFCQDKLEEEKRDILDENISKKYAEILIISNIKLQNL